MIIYSKKSVDYSEGFKTIKVILCLIVLLLFSCNSANDYSQKADIAINKGNYREAMLLLDKALAKKKYLSEAYTEKGYCYTMLNKDDSALIVYGQLISYSSKNTLALFNSGNCKYRQRKFEEAINFYNSAMKTKGYNPNDSIAPQIVFEYTPAGKDLLGINDRFDVQLAEIYYQAGLVHYELNQIKRAYGYFSKCISDGFNIGQSHYMIALCWLASNNKEKACQAFKTSILNGYKEAEEQFDKTCK
jgi:tetratricopeptide (TPR) repeat protein